MTGTDSFYDDLQIIYADLTKFIIFLKKKKEYFEQVDSFNLLSCFLSALDDFPPNKVFPLLGRIFSAINVTEKMDTAAAEVKEKETENV